MKMMATLPTSLALSTDLSIRQAAQTVVDEILLMKAHLMKKLLKPAQKLTKTQISQQRRKPW